LHTLVALSQYATESGCLCASDLWPCRLTQQSSAARAVGTTVAAANIFQPLPVRRRELERNVKREYAKLILALQVRLSPTRSPTEDDPW